MISNHSSFEEKIETRKVDTNKFLAFIDGEGFDSLFSMVAIVMFSLIVILGLWIFGQIF